MMPNTITRQPIPTIILVCINACLLTCLTIQIIQSLVWPIAWDAAATHYPAWLISQGFIPYRDIFDQQFPGIYLLHLCIIKFIGESNLAFRTADLLSLLLINIGIIGILRKKGWLTILLAAALFSTYHLNGTVIHAGQRDFFMLMFFSLGTYCIIAGLQQKIVLSKLFWGGLLLGAVTTIKPHTGLFYLMIAFLTGVYAVRQKQNPLKTLGVFFISGAIVPVGVTIWLSITGGLIPLMDMLFNYLLPSYASMEHPQSNLRDFLFNYKIFYVPIVLEAIAVALLTLLLFLKQKRAQTTQLVLLSGVVYGLIHYFSQGRAWFYHLYPLVFFMLLLVVSWLPGSGHTKKSRLQYVFIAIALQLTLGIGYQSVTFIKNNDAIVPANNQYISHVLQLEKDMKARLAPGDKVQMIATMGSGCHALYRLKVPMATRYMLCMHILSSIDTPYARKIKNDFVTKLQQDPPKLIVVLKRGYLLSGYERLNTIPKLCSLLEDHYTLVLEQTVDLDNAYRIYERTRPPMGAVP